MTSFSKNRFQKLAGILKEDIATFDQLKNWDNPGWNDSEPPHVVQPELNLRPSVPDMTKEMLQSYPAWLRAIHLWFHGAHHATRGTGFSGDHVDLYDRIYTEVQNEVDGAVEKIVGLFNDEKLACPRCITTKALEYLNNYESPAELEADEIPSVGLRMIKDYLDYLQNCADNLEQGGKMTMGLDDHLYASANTHETYVYLLQQRIKSGS